MVDPWSYAAKTNTELAHQTSLFMWANMAANFGFLQANDPESYTLPGYAKRCYYERGGPLIPELEFLHAIKNQGHGDRIRGAQSRAEGVKAGVPDIFLPVPAINLDWLTKGERNTFHGIYIELKRPASAGKAEGKPSDDQIRWQNYLRSAGYKVEIIAGWELARDEILRYLGRG